MQCSGRPGRFSPSDVRSEESNEYGAAWSGERVRYGAAEDRRRHGKDQRAAAESEVAAHDAAAGAAPTAEAEPKPSQQTCSAEVGVVGMAVMQ